MTCWPDVVLTLEGFLLAFDLKRGHELLANQRRAGSFSPR